MVDTTLHVVDPKNPGAVDEIIHLGDYWDEAGIRANKKQILTLNAEVSRLFQSAYRYLAAARKIHENWQAKVSLAQDWGWVNQQTALLLDDILAAEPVAPQPGKGRHLFAAAFTPEGPRDYLETIMGPVKRLVVIKGLPGSGKSTLLCRIGNAARERGYFVEYYHSPLEPNKVEHLLIPQLDVGLTVAGELFAYTPNREVATVNLDYGLNRDVMNRNRVEMKVDRETFFQLLNTALNLIKQAKLTHDEMERYYVPYMDFKTIDEVREQVLERILAYAQEQAVV